MMPVVDKPAIQYVVEEAVKAGIDDILIITGRSKRAIEDHFDRNLELEHFLDASGKHDLLKEVQFASDLADIHYVRQHDPLGLGHAVSVARHHVGNEPFAVLLADDLMIDDGALLRAMLDVHEREQRSCIAFTEVSPEEISSYGCIEPDPTRTNLPNDVVQIRRVVEKPPRDEAPSNFAISGRYVFTPEIFAMLDLIEPGRGGELQLTDAIALLLARESVFGYQCRRGRYDVGQKIDFLRANVELALDRPDLGPAFGEWLRRYVETRWPR
jgi:UTP--glucose-1-phosphate uridylyltransferase